MKKLLFFYSFFTTNLLGLKGEFKLTFLTVENL